MILVWQRHKPQYKSNWKLKSYSSHKTGKNIKFWARNLRYLQLTATLAIRMFEHNLW